MEPTTTVSDEALVHAALHRVCNDLSMITDRELRYDPGSVTVERVRSRPSGAGEIHISFKLSLHEGESLLHGCLLLPLPDAIALACYMMMVPDELVGGKRNLETLDSGLKEAMLEVGNFIGGATDAALRGLGIEGIKVRTEGCQGVRADVRPALSYEEGAPLIAARSQVKLHTFPAFEAVLVLPVFGGVQP